MNGTASRFLLAPWQEEGLEQIFGPLDDEVTA